MNIILSYKRILIKYIKARTSKAELGAGYIIPITQRMNVQGSGYLIYWPYYLFHYSLFCTMKNKESIFEIRIIGCVLTSSV
jgi:hypothetical protein